MNIVFIGSPYVNSTSRAMAKEIVKFPECRWAGFIDSFRFVEKYCRHYSNVTMSKNWKEDQAYPLSYFWKIAPTQIKEDFDVIFIEQNGFKFYNDSGIPVVYYHRDIPTPLFMEDMDILLYRFKKMERVISEEYPQIWNNGIYKERFLNGVDVDDFKHDLPKIYEGINWIGWRKTFEFFWKIPNQKEYYTYVKEIVDYARKNILINYHPHGIAYSEAKRILKQSEAVLVIPGNEAYVTRKIYEAAATKTLIVLWVQNKEAEDTFRELGLVHNKNCIMFRKKEELKELSSLKGIDIEGITLEAYKWVSENHTWKNRCNELMEILKKNGIT